MSYIDDSVSSTIEWEGVVTWMYQDTEGVVTVGCGFALFSPADACKLPFYTSHGVVASDDVVIADFRRVAAMTKGMRPAVYFDESSVTMNHSDVEQWLRKRINVNDSSLRKIFSGWDAFPDSAKLALLDMDYNLGDSKLLHGYPNLNQAIHDRDWVRASAECHRFGLPDTRNGWTKNMFLQAVSAAQ